MPDEENSAPIAADARRFNLILQLASLVGLAMLIAWRSHTSPNPQDFSQFYMGGLMASPGLADEMYPIPHADSIHNPGPAVESDMPPKYARQAQRVGVGNSFRFIQPPPTALLFAPLSYYSYRVAQMVWLGILTVCAWIAAVQAGRIYGLLRGVHGGGGRAEGIITCIATFSPLTYWSIRVQNTSPIVAALIGMSVLALLENRPARVALAVVLGGILKYASGILLPLFIVLRAWRELVLMAVFTIIVLLITLFALGRAPFAIFFTDIAPTLSRPFEMEQNQSLAGFLLRITHQVVLPHALNLALNLLRWGSLAGLCLLLARRPRLHWQQPCNLIPAAAALLAWLAVFSPIFWEHYAIYFVPFWGWLIWEIRGGGGGGWRRWVGSAAIALHWGAWPIWWKHIIPEPACSIMLWGSICLLLLATVRIAESRAVERAA